MLPVYKETEFMIIRSNHKIITIKINNYKRCTDLQFSLLNKLDSFNKSAISLEDLEEEEERFSSFSTSLRFIIPLKNKEKVENQEYKN